MNIFRTNNGGEYVRHAFNKYLLEEDIHHEFTARTIPKQNSIAERDNRTIIEMVRSSIHHLQFSSQFWTEAVHYVIYTLNCTSYRLLNGLTKCLRVLNYQSRI